VKAPAARLRTSIASVRKVRVPGVPADFRVPPGWPTPTDRWVRANTFWQPPAGWAPLPDTPAAPDGWRYWDPNPEWDRRYAANYRHIAVWGRVPNVLAVVWLLLVVASFFAPEVVAFALLGWLALLAAFGCLVVHEVLRRRITKRALTYLAGVAADARGKNLIREYQRYLMDAA
jgi:hypothetical protein